MNVDEVDVTRSVFEVITQPDGQLIHRSQFGELLWQYHAASAAVVANGTAASFAADEREASGRVPGHLIVTGWRRSTVPSPIRASLSLRATRPRSHPRPG